MRWLTLFNKIGKQPIRVTQEQDVYAILYDKKSHGYEKRYLCLKFDAQNRPYLIEDMKTKEKHENPKRR